MDKDTCLSACGGGGGGVNSELWVTNRRQLSADRFLAMANNQDQSVEDRCRLRVKAPGTIKSLSTNVRTNGHTDTYTLYVRKNGVNTSMKVEIPTTSIGVFEDETNTFTVAADDYLVLRGEIIGAATGVVEFEYIEVEIEYD